MKVLHIVRHAHAVSRKQGLPDFERPLIKKGVKAARDVARRLKKSGFSADHLVSSPANRAIETARVFSKEFGFPVKKIELQQSVYSDADNASLLTLVRNVPASSSNAFLFGHDPSFSDFTGYLIKGFEESMPKGAVVTVAFDCESWSDIGPGTGQLRLFDYPMRKSERARRFKLLRREVADLLTSAMCEKLEGLDARAAKKAEKYTRKVSRRVAERFLRSARHLQPGTTKAGLKPQHHEPVRQAMEV